MVKRKKSYIPKTKEEVLNELKQKDKFNLLAVKSKDKAPTSDEVLISKFEEINSFIDENKRLPDGKSSPIEFKLHTRALEINLDDKKIKALREYDRYNLLRTELESDEELVIISEQVENKVEETSKLGLADKFGLLASTGNSIFNLKHVEKREAKTNDSPDEVAKRKKCKEFEIFEPLFLKCQNELDSGERKVAPFRNEQSIKKESFFILAGIKCYVAEMGTKKTKKGHNNARLRVIFENGLESKMYLRSLSSGLYRDGRRILAPRIRDNDSEISEKETTGYIYVLRSKSEDEEIKSIPNLHKIGFSTTPVKDRIKNAKNEGTYLMAEVEEISSYRVGGISPRYFEKLIHTLFSHVQLVINVIDNEGVTKKPKEWFSVPYDVIEDTIELIETGEIVDYTYDADKCCLIKSK